MRFVLAMAMAIALTACGARDDKINSAENVQVLTATDPRTSAILAGLTPVIAEDLGQQVLLKIEVLRIGGGYAYFVGEPRTLADQPIDFAATHYRQAIDAGMFDGQRLSAYLREEKGAWKVLAFAQGPTDLPDIGWPDEFGGPFDLLGLPPVPEAQ